VPKRLRFGVVGIEEATLVVLGVRR
jgi:hypothetical protein